MSVGDDRLEDAAQMERRNGLIDPSGRPPGRCYPTCSLLLLAAALLCCVDAQSEGDPGSVASLRRQAFAAVNAHNPYEAARLFGHVAELEPGAGSFQNLGTALLNLGNTEGGAVEAVQMYLHALACFRLALAEQGGVSAEVVENIEVVESNCRKRYNLLCEDMPEAAMQASTLAETGPLAHVGAILAPHMAATTPGGASTSAARKTARGRKDGGKKAAAPMEDKKALYAALCENFPCDPNMKMVEGVSEIASQLGVTEDQLKGKTMMEKLLVLRDAAGISMAQQAAVTMENEDEDEDEDEEDEEEQEEMEGEYRAAPADKSPPRSATKQKTPEKATPVTNAGKDAGSGRGTLKLEDSPEAVYPGLRFDSTVSADPMARVALNFDAGDAADWPAGEYAATKAALARLKTLLMDAGYHQAEVMGALKWTVFDSFRPEKASKLDSVAKTQAALQAFESGETQPATPMGPQKRAMLAYLMRLFFCRLRVEPGPLQKALGQGMERLEDGHTQIEPGRFVKSLGILERHAEGTISSRVQVTPMLSDLHIFTDWQQTVASETVEPVMYLTTCSQGLSWVQPRKPAQHVLDLCSGSGVHGIVAARYYAEHVTFVDFNPRAVRFSRLNLVFNSLERKGTVLLGDLYSALRGKGEVLVREGGPSDGRFDVILANPPYIPIPKGLKARHAYGDGGPDGERIIKRIIQMAPLHLTNTGRVHIVSNLMNPSIYERKLWKWWTANLHDRWEVDSQTGVLDKYARAPQGEVAAFHVIRGDIWSADDYGRRGGPTGLKEAGIHSVTAGFVFIYPNRNFQKLVQHSSYVEHHDHGDLYQVVMANTTASRLLINKYRDLDGYFDKTGPDPDADMKYLRPEATLDRRGGDREL